MGPNLFLRGWSNSFTVGASEGIIGGSNTDPNRCEWVVDGSLYNPTSRPSARITLAYSSPVTLTIRLRHNTSTSQGTATGTVLYEASFPAGSFPTGVSIDVGPVAISALGYLKLTAQGSGAFIGFPAVTITPGPELPVANLQEVPVPDDLGTDLDVLSDLRPSFVLCSGLTNLGNALARRVNTPEGALAAINDDPDYGYDLRAHLNDDGTVQDIAAIGPRVEHELLKDERVSAADVELLYSFAGYALALDCSLETVAGPFRLILGVGTATVDVINEGLVTTANP